MRLGDLDALKEMVDKINDTDYGSIFDYTAHREVRNVLRDIKHLIDNTPTVDAVEVVRCKDCVHAGTFPNAYAERRFEGGMNCYLCRGDDGYGIANVSVVYPDGYCDDGVRKEQKNATD